MATRLQRWYLRVLGMRGLPSCGRGGVPVSRVRPSNEFPGGPLAGVPSLSREVKANRCRVAEL